ncbi:hypothetical protein BCU97_05105 [Vibrio splendidus]|nr:hypothetical protein BCU97_05105 [Vibrio splendidus]
MGEHQTLIIPVIATDNNGGNSVSQNLIIRIDGTNDKPVLNHISSQTVNEGDPQITGQISSTDVDHGDTATYSSPLTQPGFTLNPDGTYVIDPTDPSFNHLAVGEHQTLIIPVIATDNNGGNSVSQNLVIRIDGTNDKPIVSSWAQLPDGVEDKTVIIKEADLLTHATDVDTSDTLTVTHLQAEHGTIVDNKDGTYTYSPDKDYNGEVRLTCRVEDGHGGQVDTQARFNLAAVADTAKIGGQDTATLEEFGDRTSALADMTDHSPDYHQEHQSKLFNQILSAKGHLTITDPDIGEAEFQWKPTINGQYGHLSIWDNGNWVYEVSAGNSAAGRAIDKLGQGEELTDTMTVHSKDGTPHDIVITIHGDNDRPYCSSEVILNAGTEDTRQNITVADLLQNTVDVDHNDAGLLTIANLHADHGSIAINKDGSFSFTPDKDYNGPVHFTYDVKDGHGGVTHTGATTNLAAVNDAAIIKGDDTADVHEDALGNQTQYGAGAGGYGYDLTVSGKLDIVDPDQGEDNFPQGHGASTWYTGDHGGQLIIGATGSWTYNINNAAPSIQRLGLGESMVDTVQVHSADGTTHNIAITIHGTNDAPVLAAQTHSVIEDGSLLKGTMIATDVDHGDSQIFSISNVVDGLTFNADGSYSFDPSNAAYQHLANGQTQTLTIPVTVTDSAGATDTQNLAITITGTNDASVLANGLASTTVTEDQTSSANQLSSSWQNLAITDVDSTAEAAIVQIEVNGVLHKVPADFAMSLQGDHGTFHTTHGTDGHDKWRYTADNTHSEVQGLKDGQSLTDSITLITTDGTRIPITATIQGSDDHVIIDTPNAVTASLGTAIEDTKTSISGMLAAHDVDTNDSVHFEVQNTAGSYGSLSVSQDGRWHYDLDPAKANPLTPWDNVPEVFNVVAVSSDGSKTTQRIQVNVQGTSDAAIIKGVDTGSITEDHHIGSSSPHTIAVSGLLTVSDPDAGQDHFQFSQLGEQAIHDPFGGYLRITPSGNWGYSVSNSALQHIHEGDADNVVYCVQSADGTSHLITITVTGTNDAPVLTAQTQSVIEDGSALKGQMKATDVDDNTHLSFEIANPVDGLTFNSDGSYSFDPSNATYQHLVSGQNQTLTIPVTVKDEANATSTQNLTIVVHGTNDGAIIRGQDTGAVTEDSHVASGDMLVTQGVLVSNDPDTSDTGFTGDALQTLKDGSTASGVLQMGKSGTWIYTVDNKSVQSMAAGETKTEIFEVKSIDGTTHDIEVTITGTNDQPVLGVTQATHSTGTLTETDIDSLDTHTFSVVQGAGNFGTLSVDPQTGAYTYTPSGSIQGMHYHSQQGHYVGVDTFEIKVADNQGGESSEFITFGAQGVVTAPTGSSTTPTITTSVPSPAIVTATASVTGANPAVSNTVTLDLANSSDTGSSDTDNLTQDTTPTIDGHTDIPFSQVTIYDGSQNAIGHGTSDASGGFSITVSAISDGVHHFTASALDPSAVAPTISSTLDITVDTQADIRVNVIENPAGGILPNLQLYMAQDVTPTSITLVDEHGNSVTVDPTSYHSSLASFSHPDHNYLDYRNIDVTSLNGNIHAEVDGIDTAGNTVQDLSGAKTVQVLSAIGVSLTHDTGTDTNDHITSDGTLSVSGQDHGTSLQYSIDGGHHWTNSFTPTSGVNTVEVRQVSPSGSISTPASLTFTLDSSTAAPTVTLTTDSGTDTTDSITNTGGIIATATELGATLEYSHDGGNTWSTTKPTPVEGTNNVLVHQIDIAGNVSPSATISYTLDTNIDKTSVDLQAGSDSGISDSDDLTNVHTPILTGVAQANAAISITDETGAVVATTQADSQGHYQVATQSLIEGPHTLTITATDTAGNTDSASLSLEVDDTAPTISNVNLQTITTRQATFEGKVATDTTQVDIVIKQGSPATVVETLHASLDGQGGYHVSSADLPDGPYVAYIQATDKAGNTTASGQHYDRFTVDTHADSPTISFESTGTDAAYNAAEVAVGAANTITATIHLPHDVDNSSSIEINGQTRLITYSEVQAGKILVELPPGSGLTTMITDSSGNHSSSVQATAPGADITVNQLTIVLTNDTGTDGDLITNDGSLTITGQESRATVEYSTDNGHTWTSSFTPQQGPNTISVRQTDAAGNVSASSSLSFTLDNTATAPSVSLTSDSGSSSSDNITNVGDLNIGGIEQGATVEYSIDNGVHWSTQFTPNEGMNNVQVRQTDVSGKVSPSTSLTYTLDTQTDIRVNSAQVDQHGQGMMVQVYLPKDSEVTLIEITSDGGGTPLLIDLKTVQRQGTGTSVSHPNHQYQEFVGIDLSSLPDGHLTIRVAGTDAAGNTVTAQSSASSNYVLDTTASVNDDSNTAVEDSTSPVTGNLLSNDVDATTVTTTGDIQGTYGTFHLTSDGSYTYTLNNQLSVIQQLDSTSSPLVDSIAYTARDNHGNQATAHLAISIQGTDDNHAPVVTAHKVSTDEDTTHTFATAEFGYTDQDGDTLHFITISQLPTNGLLLLNGKAITTNQQISKVDLDAGHLTFTPIHNENGTNYANIEFTANDGYQDSASASMVFDVNAINDAPTVGSNFTSLLEDKPHNFTKDDFKYADVDGDSLHHITITNIAHGSLTLNGRAISVGDDVAASDLASLSYTPDPNYHSVSASGLGGIQFTANDGHVDSKPGMYLINIVATPDPATFTGDSTGQAQEDLHTQTTGVLNAIDPDGTQGFIAVQGGVGIVGSKGYGHAHIDSNGHWTYNLYNNHAVVQQLAEGQTETETITVQSADGTNHDIVITIAGTNDLPTVTEKPQAGYIVGQHSVDEDSGLNPAGQLIINDVDGDTTTVTLDPAHSATYGHVVFDSHSDTWVYHLDNNNPTVNALNDHDTLQDKFTLLVDDGHGQKVPQEITMSINGHTDPVPYTPPTISVNVDTRHAHHIAATGITSNMVHQYAQQLGASFSSHNHHHGQTTYSNENGHHEIKGHDSHDIIVVSGSLNEEADLKDGNDILFIGGRLTDKEIEGGHGSDTLILGAYNRNNAPRLHDHGEKISDGHEEMELESIENIILGDGTVLKGHLPPNFPSVAHDHYEVPVNIQAHLSSSDESVSNIRLTHLQQGLTLQSNGHDISANQDGSYTVPSNGHLVVVSAHPINSGHHYFETEVTTHNSVTGVTAMTTEDLQGHIQSHVNPPPPPPPPVQHDEPNSPLTFEASVTIADDSNDPNEQHVSATDAQHHDVSHHGAAAYLDALGIKPDTTSTVDHDQPADMDIVLAQVDQQDAATHDQAHLDMSDALEHHDAANNHNQDDEHHHHNDVDGLPDIDPNS